MKTASPSSEQVKTGMWLGFVGVVIFAATLPMTKLAVGTADTPQLSPWFVTFGRAVVAGVLSIIYLAWVFWRSQRLVQAVTSITSITSITSKSESTALRWKLPSAKEWQLLAFTACGVVVGFPLFLSLALLYVPSTHGAVVTGLLPLTTAVIAALWFKQKPTLGFWLCAVLGTLLVLGFMLMRSQNGQGQWQLQVADVYLVLAMLSASFGYIGGARLTPSLGAQRVICWVLVLSLPVTIAVAWINLPMNVALIRITSWLAFGYVAVFSMWIGFFAWYRGLALGGAVRVSQVQLVQPFLSLFMAVPILGEKLDAMTLVFALAVIATVFVGKNMSVGATK